MFSQAASTKIERLCKTELYIKIVEHVDADDPRDPEDDEDEQEQWNRLLTPDISEDRKELLGKLIAQSRQ